MALRKPVFAPSVFTSQTVTVVLWEENCVCNIHSRVQPCPADEYGTPFQQLKPFERGQIVGLRQARWTYQRIVAHIRNNESVVCRWFQQCSVEHSHTRRPGSGRPRSTDARQDRRIMHAAVAARTPAVSQRTIGNRVLAARFRSCVPLTWLSLRPRDS